MRTMTPTNAKHRSVAHSIPPSHQLHPSQPVALDALNRRRAPIKSREKVNIS